MYSMPQSRAAILALTLGGVAGSVLSAQGVTRDYRPTSREVVLDTDVTQITPVGGPPITVRGGVFVFRNVTIPAGVNVRGVGSNPMIWIVTGDFAVEGSLSVNGANGARVDTLNSANFPTPGGVGGCAAGFGGDGSPESMRRSLRGQAGSGPMGTPGLGGGGGRLSCVPSCRRGSAGGGGSFATLGDPYYVPSGQISWPQVSGNGGQGCLDRSLAGGLPGMSPFVDGRSDNDFVGLGVDVNRRIFVVGELPALIGGFGGGGGGDLSANCTVNDPNFINDSKGGGGGGGGGALVIAAVGQIRIGANGRISANGGHGGGGEQAGSNNLCGGGGGGSGGLVLLYAQQRVEIEVHGETLANGDFDFPLSADGGIGLQGGFGGVPISGKYPIGNSTWNRRPTGGFGGLGIIQFFTRPGTNTDGTNTLLDDNIRLMRNGQALVGSEKTRYLAWRGYPDVGGTLVDDFGAPTAIGRNIGDIQPTPVLIPIL